MSDIGCFENGHIKKKAFALLDNEDLDAITKYNLSEHLASCIVCSGNYAEFLTTDLQIEVPEGFNKVILSNARLSALTRQNNKFTASQCLKLATAAVLAISFYSAGIFNSFFNITNDLKSNIPQTTQLLQLTNLNITQKFNEGFLEFSQKINNFNGVDLYEKK